MCSNRVSLFIRRLKKAIGVLREKGLSELVTRVKGFVRRRGQIEIKTRHVVPLEYDTSPVRFNGKKLEKEKLALVLSLLREKRFSLAISQDDYLNIVGGVQLKLLNQQRQMNNEGLAFLHLSPYSPRTSLDFSQQEGIVRINLDGEFLGFAGERTLIMVLEDILPSENFNEIHIHHLMGWKTETIEKILKIVAGKPIYYWIHDFFSICPNYSLLRNGIEYCHAPSPDTNACQICVYGAIRPRHFQAFKKLFQEYPIEVIAPSDFALKFWREKFLDFNGPSRVEPHADIKWTQRFQNNEQPLKVAFVGYPVMHKGWQTWLKLTKIFGKDPRYRFFHFSTNWQRSPNFDKVAVSVNQQNWSAMTDALRENNIDIAFLWSVCPETFSFTLYESLSAGCFIITNPYSGNIQDYISKNPKLGRVYSDDEELIQAFETGDVITNFLEFNSNVRQLGTLILNPIDKNTKRTLDKKFK